MLICLDQRSHSGCQAHNPDNATRCQQCGRDLRFALKLQDPGTVIGNYRIEQVIGHGGFGAVYEATQRTSTGSKVALKENFESDMIQRFQREFQVLRALKHDNLPRYDAMFEQDGNAYLVMELVVGQNLEEILQRNQAPLMVAQVLAYSVQLCDVLNYLHRQNPPILHRDIKPANIRLTPDGLIKLVDFGLLKQGTGPTTRRALTPNYAPLEQWGQGGQHTDARSDIYSLGATLYHLLTGQLPLPAVDRISQGGDTLPSPLTYNAQLPPNVVYAIVKALAIKPEDRYPDAEKMKHDLVSGTKALTEPYVGPTRVPGADAPTRVVPVPVSEPRTPTVKNHAGFCRQCGEPYQNDEIYCQKCGRPISIQSRVCSRCKGKNALNARFCTKCGNAL